MGRIENFLKMFESRNTVSVYKSRLKTFFNIIYGESEDLDAAAEKYFTEKRDYEADVQALLSAIKDSPPFTIRAVLSCVRSFLVENGVELNERFWRRIRMRVKGSRAVSEEKIPNRNELQKILSHLPLNGRALALVLLSSGARIGEVLSLKIEDLDLAGNPPRFRIRAEYTKTRTPRTAFITNEAKAVLEEWLKIRDQYIKSAVAKTWHQFREGEQLLQKYKENPKAGSFASEVNSLIEQLATRQNSRVFPFESVNFYTMWERAVKKAGLFKRDEATKHLTLRPHVLRKYFRGQLGAFSVDLTEAIMGHEGYLTECYRRYPNPEETFAHFYSQYEYVLRVFETGDMSKLQEELQQQREQLQAIVNGLTRENLELKQRMQRLEQKLSEIEKALQDVAN